MAKPLPPSMIACVLMFVAGIAQAVNDGTSNSNTAKAVSNAESATHSSDADKVDNRITQNDNCNETETTANDSNTSTLIEQQLIYENFDLFKRGTVKRNSEHFISVAQLKADLDARRATLIDLRQPEDFAALHIPQSLNMRADELDTKAFLHDKRLVLVDEGYADSKMAALLIHLKDSGFKNVVVLDGGLNAWQFAGEKFSEFKPPAQPINFVTPQQFFSERQYSDWLVLNSPPVKSTEQQHLVNEFKHQLQQAQVDGLRILIVSETGTDYQRLAASVPELSHQPRVFYLQGGNKAYQTFLSQQWAIWHRPTQKQGKTNTCGRRKR